MSYIETQIAIMDYKIDELIAKKKLIDIRIAELYEQREDLITELEVSKKQHCGECE